MTLDRTLERVRRANPAPAAPIEDAALFEAIVATPPDARSRSGRTRRSRRRSAWILALGAVVSIGGATAWATGAASPLALFQAPSTEGESPNMPWHQDIIPGSVHKATSELIPNVGTAELWFAETRQGGFCTAIRLPDGTWAGTMEPDRAQDESTVDAGSTRPGCQATHAQVNEAYPDSPIFVLTGFDYNEADVRAPGPGNDIWRLLYGTVDATPAPVRVVDRISGRSAPVAEGHVFAIALHDPDPTRLKQHFKRLVALDAHGRVVASEP